MKNKRDAKVTAVTVLCHKGLKIAANKCVRGKKKGWWMVCSLLFKMGS